MPAERAQYRAGSIRPGDVIDVGERIKVQRVESKPHVLTGRPMFNVYREPDGRLALSLYDTDTVTAVKPATCRACHYGHLNECEDDRCDCR